MGRKIMEYDEYAIFKAGNGVVVTKKGVHLSEFSIYAETLDDAKLEIVKDINKIK